jgi:hypothetical protein
VVWLKSYRKRLGVTYEAARVRQIAEKAIREGVQSKDNPADLINVALEELVPPSVRAAGAAPSRSGRTSCRR